MIELFGTYTEAFLQFIETNVGMFIVEVGLLVVLLPAYLAHVERRKWRTMRKELYFCFYDMLNDMHPLLMNALDSGATPLDQSNFDRLYDNLKSKLTILGLALIPQ